MVWSLGQRSAVTYLVFGVMGLGMAAPYLVAGIEPRLVNWLPKPGMWMVRFKEFAGLCILGAVVWLIDSLETQVVLPVLILLMAISVALWMVGRLYDHSSAPLRKWTVRALAAATMFVVGAWGYGLFEDGLAAAVADREAVALLASTTTAFPDSQTSESAGESDELPWEPFSTQRLTALLEEGKPVLVDFTADWCLVCKTNEKLVLNTKATSDFVREHGIATLVADYTHENPEIKEWLRRFESSSVPLYVIFKRNNPREPIVFDGLLTQAEILEKLQQAVSADMAAAEKESRSDDLTRR